MKKSLILGVLVGAVLFASAASYAAADTATITKVGSGTTAQTATDTVTVKTTINPKLVLTVVTPAASQTVDFGTLDPGTVTGTQPVSLTVSSNKTYNITIAKVGDAAIGLNTTLANSTNNAKTASQVFPDTYSLNVPWTTDPGTYTATVQYTVVQN
ncbi:MAG: hypothetical protein P4L93_03395 [Coriobacteriia bacterium]|nr:hypothetical protein [Coriobacteriia bacterium]